MLSIRDEGENCKWNKATDIGKVIAIYKDACLVFYNQFNTKRYSCE